MESKLGSAISDSGAHIVSSGYLTFFVIIALSETRRRPPPCSASEQRAALNSIRDLPRIGG
jgi:hypothetical protein